MTILRLLVAWAVVVVAFAMPALFAGAAGWQDGLVFAAMLAIMLWSAFGVTTEAEHLAEILGEPYGTLILTLAIVLIEVALIAAVMLGGKDAPTLGRDTMFAVVMSVMNGIVGLGLLVGGLRHGAQRYNMQGAAAYLATIIPLSVIAFILPNFTRSTPGGTLTYGQEIAFSIFCLALYATFLVVQTARHTGFFLDPPAEGDTDPAFVEVTPWRQDRSRPQERRCRRTPCGAARRLDPADRPALRRSSRCCSIAGWRRRICPTRWAASSWRSSCSRRKASRRCARSRATSSSAG